MRPTWLVTGSAGFLGANAGLWLADRAETVGQARSGPAPTSEYGRTVLLDLRDLTATAAMVRRVRPDVILHAAAISGHETCAHDPEQAFAVNVEASRVIAETAAEVGARMIYISTDAVFSGARGNYAETDEPEPFSNYGETKLLGEKAVLASATDALVARTNFFGWSTSGRRSVLEFFVNSLRAGQDVKGYPDFIVTSIYVRSLVEILWRLTELRASGVVHVASSDAVSKHDFGVTVARVFGLAGDLISPEHSDVHGHLTSRSRDISLSTELLASLVGAPPTQADGVRRAAEDEQTVAAALRLLEVQEDLEPGLT